MCNCKNSKDKDYVLNLAIKYGKEFNLDIYLYQSLNLTWHFCEKNFIPLNIKNYVKINSQIS